MPGTPANDAAPTWVALLRAINLGTRNRIPMAELRRVFEETGCEDVRTYIASGNVVFARDASDGSALVETLEDAVEAAFGFRSTIILRTGDELRRVAETHPFGKDTSQSHVTFLSAEPDAAAVERLESLDVAPDRFVISGADVFLHYPGGVQGSRLTNAVLERELGVRGTTRTWRTVERLADLARPR